MVCLNFLIPSMEMLWLQLWLVNLDWQIILLKKIQLWGCTCSKQRRLSYPPERGKICLRSIPLNEASLGASANWGLSPAGKVVCSSVDSKEKYALFGGKGMELNMWDLESFTRIWTSKLPPVNILGIFSPTCFTAAAYLSKEDHRKIVAGTNNYQIRLYDISAQRRPVISIDFRESPIKVVREDLNGYTVYVGTGTGDLASFDMRTGKLLGCFVGKCAGSIRSIARHPELPLLASCGLDSYLRIWDSRTRQLLSAVFLKQHLTNVVIDSHFSSEVPSGDANDQIHVLRMTSSPQQVVLEQRKNHQERRTKLIESRKKLGNKNQMFVEAFELSASDNEDMDRQTHLKRKESSKVNSKKSEGKDGRKNLKRKKSRSLNNED
ncbi:WD repeat-containing protein DDB_G0290555 isoform X2 [Phalaenopsis equestris]|uniref:WD repeat-containing protein DDB_G0290555 isoform X2 n=1 Tax=Phalaenopsis equestris TaxID=78828 RepID=UPI0009E409C0|nr:WD repeat-containing protein DDB_G0290555 isoform X2 [Phalaenopsis equestris]XP_020587245.1 WD repeat-containing protein DDB_G0290555 isoform X2 [Phalaenopsis equestris]